MKSNYLLLSIFLISTLLSFSQTESKKYSIDKDGKMIFNIPNNNKLSNTLQDKLGNKALLNLSLVWDNPDYNVSDSELDSWDSRMDMDVDGTVYVVYNEDDFGTTGLQKIAFRKKTLTGEWTEPIYIDKGGEIGGRNNHSPAIATSPNGDLHSIYNVWAYENMRNYLGYSYYDASEGEWSDGIQLSTAGGSIDHNYYHHDIYSTDDNLPVVIWGFDNRENEDYEEVYMKYYDGTNWSDDIIISTPSDHLNARYPYITSIGNHKAMIIFVEETENTNQYESELRYRIYDENTHSLTALLPIPQSQYKYYYESRHINYDIAQKDDNSVIIPIWQNNATTSSIHHDTIKCFIYDIAEDVFTLSGHQFINETNGIENKNISVDCNSQGECGIIYSDTYLQTCNFIEFDEILGFSDVQVFNQEDRLSGDKPDCKFDAAGNLHVVWPDIRFDLPGSAVERDIFYEMGTNITSHTTSFPAKYDINVYPNPSNGIINIDLPENISNSTVIVTDITGKIVYQQEVDNHAVINLHIERGVYLIRFIFNDKSAVSKIVIN